MGAAAAPGGLVAAVASDLIAHEWLFLNFTGWDQGRGSAAEQAGEETPAVRLPFGDLGRRVLTTAPVVRRHAAADLVDVLAAAGPCGLLADPAGGR